MTVKPRPGAQPSRRSPVTPQTLAAARLEAARKLKIDRSRLRDRAATSTGSTPGSRARDDLGVVAINTETIGEDPMQAPLCGIALAVAPNEACYVPLAHRKARQRRRACSAAGSHRDRFRERTRSPR